MPSRTLTLTATPAGALTRTLTLTPTLTLTAVPPGSAERKHKMQCFQIIALQCSGRSGAWRIRLLLASVVGPVRGSESRVLRFAVAKHVRAVVGRSRCCSLLFLPTKCPAARMRGDVGHVEEGLKEGHDVPGTSPTLLAALLLPAMYCTLPISQMLGDRTLFGDQGRIPTLNSPFEQTLDICARLGTLVFVDVTNCTHSS